MTTTVIGVNVLYEVKKYLTLKASTANIAQELKAGLVLIRLLQVKKENM